MKTGNYSFRFAGILIILSLVLSINFFSGCSNTNSPAIPAEPDYTKVPPGFPPIITPADNPITAAKVDLGRRLFYEPLLSRDTSHACFSCHQHYAAFTSNRPSVIEINHESTTRNPLTIFNAAYYPYYFWDGSGGKLEEIIYADFTLPSIFDNDTNVIEQRLENIPLYADMFKKAFGDSAKPTVYNVTRAITTYLRSMISGNSKYDQYINGNKSAMNGQEIRGMNLFFSDKVNCNKCHTGFLFTDFKFHNTGTSTMYFDRGRFYVTDNYNDRGKFMTPTLRNVAVSYPYMHDGEYKSLSQVLDNYIKGGHYFLNRDTLMKPLDITSQDKQDIIAFLNALTDQEFLDNPRFDQP